MLILFYHHKQLAKCSEEVEQIDAKVTSKKRRRSGLTKSEEDSQYYSTNTSKTVKVIRILKLISKAKEEEKSQ